MWSVTDISDRDYTEYKCYACKKEIKTVAIKCKKCRELFFHPGCINRHKTYNSANELVKCDRPFEKIRMEKKGGVMKRAKADLVDMKKA